MTYLPIKPVTVAGALSGTDNVAVIQSGISRLTTLALLKVFLNGTTTPVETLSVTTPLSQSAGVAFTVSGAYANATLLALDYSFDGGTTWINAPSPTITASAYSFSVVAGGANAAQVITVRDRGTPTVTAASGAFVISAATMTPTGTSGFVTQAQSSNTATFGTAVVPNAAVRVSSAVGEAASGTVVTTAGPTITIFDGTVFSLKARPDNGQLAVFKGSDFTRGTQINPNDQAINSGPVQSLLYFDGKIYQISPTGGAYTNYGSGSIFYQVGGDPRTCWAVGDPRAPNRPIPYGLGLKAENPGESGQGLTTWHNNLSRFTQIVGAPTYCGVFINFGDPPSAWPGDCVGTANSWAADPTSANLIPVCGFPMAQNNHYYGTSGTYGGTAYTHANNYDFDQFISGAYDSVIQGCVNAWLDKFNRVDFRPGYEFNGGFMPWYQGDDATTQGKFVAAFKRIHDQMKSALAAWPARYSAANGGATYSGPAKVVNVVWNPASISSENLNAFNSYPGDSYVDIIGLDSYSPLYPLDYWNWNSTGGGQINAATWAADATCRQHFWDYPNAQQYTGIPIDLSYFGGFQSVIAFAKAHNKHICFPECGAGWGPNNPVGPFDEYAFPTWLRSRCDQAVAAGVPVDYLIIWCTRQSDGQWGFLDAYEKPYEALAWSAAFGGGGTGVINYYPPAPTPIPSNGAPAVFNSLAPPAPSATTTTAPLPPTGGSESASGTIVTTVGPTIIDAAGNAYAINSGGYVVTNGAAETTISANVTKIAYYGHQFFQLGGGAWYTRTGPSATYVSTNDPTTPSASGTLITTLGPTFTDSAGTLWSIGGTATLGPGYSVRRNGADAGNTANVNQLLYYSGTVYYNNSTNNNPNDWFSLKPDGTNLAGPIADPRSTTPVNTVGNVVITIVGSNSVTSTTTITPSDYTTLYNSGSTRTYLASTTGLPVNFYVYKESNAPHLTVYTSSSGSFTSINIAQGGQAITAYGFPNITYS